MSPVYYCHRFGRQDRKPMNQEVIHLEFEYTEAEYMRAAHLLVLRNSDTLARLIFFFVSIVALALLLTLLLTDFPWWGTVLLTSLFLGTLYYNALVLAPRRYFRGDPKVRDGYALSFSEEGVAFKTQHVDSKLAWSLYTKVIEGSDMYLLVYGKDVRMMTAVPKRVFVSSAQEQAFRELLSRHITEHTS